MGKEGKYDLKLVEPPVLSADGGGASDTDSEETTVDLDAPDDDSAEILHEPLQGTLKYDFHNIPSFPLFTFLLFLVPLWDLLYGPSRLPP